MLKCLANLKKGRPVLSIHMHPAHAGLRCHMPIAGIQPHTVSECANTEAFFTHYAAREIVRGHAAVAAAW